MRPFVMGRWSVTMTVPPPKVVNSPVASSCAVDINGFSRPGTYRDAPSDVVPMP